MLNPFNVVLRSWDPQLVADFCPLAADIVIGRSSNPGRMDLTFTDPYISHRHCVLNFLPPESPFASAAALCVC